MLTKSDAIMETDDSLVKWMEHLKLIKVPQELVQEITSNLNQKSSQVTGHDVLNKVSHLLFRPEHTMVVANTFHPLLLDLLTRRSKQESKITVFITLSRLIGHFSVATEFACRLYGGKVNRILQEYWKTPSPAKKKVKIDCQESMAMDVLTACFSFLWFDPDFYVQTFDWSCLHSYSKHPDPRIRYLALQCLRVVTALPETEVYQKLLQTTDENTLNQIRMEFNHLFKLREKTNVDDSSTILFMSVFQESDFSEEIVSIQGILLPKYETVHNRAQNCQVVLVDSFKQSLEALAKCVISSQPVIIEGPVGSGKTTLVECLASLTGRTSAPALTKVQLGDQIDSKVLIGGHVCTEIPGEFVWKAGPLTSAMTQGNWLLFEDIDSAAPDVLTTIAAALKSRSLSSLPGCSVTTAVNGNFRIFFTRRTHLGHLSLPVVHSELERLANTVQLTNQSIEELKQLILVLFPSLEKVVNAVLQTYKLISGYEENNNSMKSFSERSVSLRDVIKWCKRLSRYFSGNSSSAPSAEYAFKDALDCFIPNAEDNRQKYELLGSHLNISKSDACRLAIHDPHEPDFYGLTGIKFGRVDLPRKKKDKLSIKKQKQSIFAFTRPSLNLLERIATSVSCNEPVLLVGETGTGKTSSVQFLANQLGHDLVVVNLNQQSDSCDLIGGFKPVEVKILLEPLRKDFDLLVRRTFRKNNDQFLEDVKKCLKVKRYKDFLKLVSEVYIKAKAYLEKNGDTGGLGNDWQDLKARTSRLSSKLIQEDKKSIMAFAFVEGSLVHAMKSGQWILLDEINLAENETLQSLSAVLESDDKPVIMPDKVDGEPVVKHPDFRVFACMNPATDVGKRDLPLGIRNRFTEFYVNELEDDKDLRKMVRAYLPLHQSVEKLVSFYKSARQEAARTLSDTTGHRPHYSLRTLCRALSVASRNPCGDMIRSLYESFCMSFLTQLSSKSRTAVEKMIADFIIGDTGKTKAVISKQIPQPQDDGSYLQFEGFWLKQGNQEPVEDTSYILTKTIRKNLQDMARVLSIGSNFPVLLQGETSVGKTSLIQFLAKSTGNVCRRVNNHEHTDLEEYVGCYCSDENGNLVFKEGVLVEAMRKGYWVILDELNLAPTEVLEALNRVLDDNRELFIPETQTTVKAHPGFQLFATQNPPGVYGGRKLLSRAFRNRFVELHFDEIPKDELTIILEKRCLVPPTYAKKMVTVMTDLEKNRRGSDIFAGKSGFITLRDLFRWGDRFRVSKDTDSFNKYFDWEKHLAQIGFMILAGRVRKEEEVVVIKTVLERRFLKNKERLDIEIFFEDKFKEICESGLLDPKNKHGFGHVAPTSNLKRLIVLLWNALRYREPVLLVGETGCGKTTVCQIYAALHDMVMSTVNCHMHSEGSDFLGSLRPVRDRVASNGKLFEWVDGPLVKAMTEGHVFLLDEISLADDSVLERLNSVLEPERTLLLTEKGGQSNPVIVADPSFLLVATMNPGGDYGKKELSPALRNRFTEIWCPSSSTAEDLSQIILQNLGNYLDNDTRQAITKIICSFHFWFRETVFASKTVSSLRDILSWIEFINTTTSMENVTCLSLNEAIIHGAQLVFIDAVGCGGFYASEDAQRASQIKSKSLSWLTQLVNTNLHVESPDASEAIVVVTEKTFGVGNFFIDAMESRSEKLKDYTFDCDGVKMSSLKVLRAMQLSKPILLEGVPGIGKTTLVQALAKQTGRQVVRINLSEQTDISDLFGGDFPVDDDDQEAGQFQWRDGPLLQALKSEDTWVILDELNLASQSVLEGLNACLDHRGEVFISELGRVFKVNRNQTRFFACQNPYGQGGARKGLPKSFLNRFTVVFVDSFTKNDLIQVTSQFFPSIDEDSVKKLVEFNQDIVSKVESRQIGSSGSPWEVNLRDISRCCSLILTFNSTSSEKVMQQMVVMSNAISQVYVDRFRNHVDRTLIKTVFAQVFGFEFCPTPDTLFMSAEIVESSKGISLSRQSLITSCKQTQSLNPTRNMIMSSLMTCVRMNWMSILVASHDQNADSIVECLACLCGRQLKTFCINSEMDAIELLGGFEKKDLLRRLTTLEEQVFSIIQVRGREDHSLLSSWFSYCEVKLESSNSFQEVDDLKKRINALLKTISSLTDVPEVTKITEKLESLSAQVSNCSDLSGGGSFEWNDSLLVKAMKEGHWILLRDVNLCPASVLDRLNSLFEPNGCLVLTEQGSVGSQGIPIVKPHTDFRLFMSMDPKHGELSRAMRNRGIEIFVFPEQETSNEIRDQFSRPDMKSLIGDSLLSKTAAEYPLIACQSNKDVSHRIFFSRSSFQDFDFRAALACRSFTNFNSDLKILMTTLVTSPHHPIDDRSIVEVTSERSGRLNFWHYQLWKAFHPAITVVSKCLADSVSDKELMHLRCFSQIFCDVDANDKRVQELLQQKFLMSLNEHCQIDEKVDAKALSFLSWSKVVRKHSPNNFACLLRKRPECSLFQKWISLDQSSTDFFETHNMMVNWFEKMVISRLPEEEESEEVRRLLMSFPEKKRNADMDVEELLLSHLLFSLIEDNWMTSPRLADFVNNVRCKGLLNREISLRLMHVSHMEDPTILSGVLASHLTSHSFYHEKFNFLLEESRRAPLGSVHATSDLLNITSRILSKKNLKLLSFGEKKSHLDSLAKALFSISLTEKIDDPNTRFSHILDEWTQVITPDMEILRAKMKVSRHPTLNPSHSELKTFVEIGLRSIDLGLSTIKTFSPTFDVDPSAVSCMELNHLRKVLDLTQSEISLLNELTTFDFGSESQRCHPHLTLLKKSCDDLTTMIQRVANEVKPRNSSYDSLKEFTTSIEKWILKKVPLGVTTASKSINSWDHSQYLLLENLRKNIQSSIGKLMFDYVDYSDILYPFIVGVILVGQGINRLCLALSVVESIGSNKNCGHFAQSITKSMGNYFNSDLASSCDLICEDDLLFGRLVHLTSSSNSLNLFANTIMSALMDLKNLKSLSPAEFPLEVLSERAKPLYSLFVNSWIKRREEEKAKQELDEALFHFKTEGTEEEREARELQMRFPSFRHEFADLGINYDMDEMTQTVATLDKLAADDKIVLQVIQLYKDLVGSDVTELDLWTPLKYNHDLMSFLLQRIPVEFITIKETNIMPLQLFSAIKENERRNQLQDKSARSNFNIYHDNCPSQMLKCYSLLRPFYDRLLVLLMEFEEHPVLMKLKAITERVMSFDVESPLMKFLTGIELLWQESQEWEKVYAHRQVKITAEIDSLKELIISWRKIELSNWSHCLDRISKEHQDKDLVQWWFHFFNLLSEQETESRDATIEVLKQFLEGSNLGVYATRIALMSLFCLQVANQDTTKRNILQNVTSFYSQFLAPVTAQLTVDREPIEKDVKDFVKITTFKDMNDWSLKSTIDKAHQKLNRFMKKYELVIKKPVAPFLSLDVSQDLLKPEPKLVMKIKDFLVNPDSEVVHILGGDVLSPELLSNMPAIRKNMTKFSKKIMKSFSLVIDTINDHNEILEHLCETSNDLKDSKLDLKTSDPIERKQAVHHMANRKRTCISQLFKDQTASGLSWSTGINFFRDFDMNKVFATTAPLKLDDTSIESSCNHYFFSNLALFSQLQTAVVSPSKDINSIMLDRIKGFSGHAIHLMVSHRQALTQVSVLVEELQECSDVAFKKNQSFRRSSQHIRLLVVVEKTSFILSHVDEHYSEVLGPLASGNFSLSLAKEVVSNARTRLSLESLDKESLDDINKAMMAVFPEKSPLHDELLRIFEDSQEVQDVKQNPMPPGNLCHNLITRSLKSVEKLLKTANGLSDTSGSRFLEVLSFQSIISSQDQDIKHLLADLRETTLFDDQSLSITEPFVMQYIQILRYFVTLFAAAQRTLGKNVEILLDLFVHLSQKGLCIPPDAVQDDQDGETKNDLAGMGLDDGEGAEDVSSRVDNEDQVDGTLCDGQEKPDEDKECNKEEDGIEMDGDFDGKNYDMEKGDDDQEDNDERKSNAEDEMGDNKGDEESSYDKKLWEQENEDEDDDEDMNESGEDGQGEEIGEDKIVAAEGTKGKKDDKSQPETKEKEETQEVNENDMEDDYDGEREDPTKTEDKPGKEIDSQDFELPNDLDLQDQSKVENEDNDDDGSILSDNAETQDLDDEVQSEKDPMETEEQDQETAKQVDPLEKVEKEENESEETKDALNSMNESEEPEAVPTESDVNNRDKANQEVSTNQSNEMESAVDSKENEGVGDAQLGKDEEGHQTIQATAAPHSQEGKRQTSSKTKQSKESRRSLATEDQQRPVKKQRILPNSCDKTVEETEQVNESNDFEHVTDQDISDVNVMDSAARDEAKHARNWVEETAEEEHQLQESDNDEPMEDSVKKESVKFDMNQESKSKRAADKVKKEEEMEDDVTMEGETVQTSRVERGPDSFFSTNAEYLSKSGSLDWTKVLSRVTKYHLDPDSESLAAAGLLWNECCQRVSPLVFELCQQLQLVLEPSKCSKLKGDYRTGKRINMRKVIAYIASQFRKDKIWLRRSKPSKRCYQIILAVDDSQSMADNESKMMAFESLALLSKSLSLVEAGQLAVMTFGEEAKLLHSLDETFSDASASRLLTEFSFNQKKTRVDSLLTTVSSIFLNNKTAAQSSSEISQLLIIISDGRGLFSEGQEVTQRIRELNDAGVFCVFVILDTGKSSILDHEYVTINPNGSVQRESYMHHFPFPFYVVLRDVNNIPTILGESLRQWFQVISQHK